MGELFPTEKQVLFGPPRLPQDYAVTLVLYHCQDYFVFRGNTEQITERKTYLNHAIELLYMDNPMITNLLVVDESNFPPEIHQGDSHTTVYPPLHSAIMEWTRRHPNIAYYHGKDIDDCIAFINQHTHKAEVQHHDVYICGLFNEEQPSQFISALSGEGMRVRNVFLVYPIEYQGESMKEVTFDDHGVPTVHEVVLENIARVQKEVNEKFHEQVLTCTSQCTFSNSDVVLLRPAANAVNPLHKDLPYKNTSHIQGPIQFVHHLLYCIKDGNVFVFQRGHGAACVSYQCEPGESAAGKLVHSLGGGHFGTREKPSISVVYRGFFPHPGNSKTMWAETTCFAQEIDEHQVGIFNDCDGKKHTTSDPVELYFIQLLEEQV